MEKFDYHYLIKLAYIFLTINKAQALKHCDINFKESYFSQDQLYIACSRVGNLKNLYTLCAIVSKDFSNQPLFLRIYRFIYKKKHIKWLIFKVVPQKSAFL